MPLFADHVSLFPRGSVLTKFKDELTGFKTSKGTVQFPLNKPVPVALIKRIVKGGCRSMKRKRGIEHAGSWYMRGGRIMNVG